METSKIAPNTACSPWRFPRLAGALASVLLVALAGACGGVSDQDLFQAAEDLYREGRYADAIPLLKEYLLRHPEHSGAHLYLGSCYLLSDQWASIADGEIRTALYYFNRDGKRSTIPRFSDEYFEIRCYLELIKAELFRYRAALEPTSPPELLDISLRRLRERVAEAQAVAPDNEEVRAMAAEVDELEAYGRATKAQQMEEYRRQIQRHSGSTLPGRQPY